MTAGPTPTLTSSDPSPLISDRAPAGSHRQTWLKPFTLGLAGLCLGWLLLYAPFFRSSEAWGHDYRASPDAAIRLGEIGSPYEARTLDGPYRPGPPGLYMYAPPLAVALAPATAAPVDAATNAWFLLHVAVLALACAVMPVRSTVRLAVFVATALSYPAMKDLVLGNVSILLLLPVAIAWRRLDEPLGSIAQAVAISVRPTLAVLLIWQALRRRWGAVAWTLAAGVVLMALTIRYVGLRGYTDYLAVLRNMSAVTGVRFNHDLSSSALQLGLEEPLPTLLLLAGCAVAIGAILASVRRDREMGFIVTVTASLLLSPLLWDHYLAMLAIPAAFLAERGRPIALALPLLAWLPRESMPFRVILATLLPFWARNARPWTNEDAAQGSVMVAAPHSSISAAAAR